MSDQFLSSDPAAGLLSTDPNAGVMATAAANRFHIGPEPAKDSFEGLRLSPKARETLNTPVARPTGIDAVDNLLTPANLTTMGIFGLAKGIASAAGTGTAARVAEGAKGIASAAGPQLKYEIVKSGLEFLHVPTPVAIPVALAVSGYKRGANAPAAEHPTTSPAESASGGTPLPADRQVSPTPAAAPTAAHPTRTAGQMSPTAIQSDLGLAARRAGVSLPPNSPQAAQAEALVRQGQTIEQAVQAAGIPAATATPTAPPKPKLTADEFRAAAGEYVKLRQQGMTDAQAKQAIVDALAMQKSLGLKTPTTAQTKFPKGMRGKTPSPEP